MKILRSPHLYTSLWIITVTVLMLMPTDVLPDIGWRSLRPEYSFDKVLHVLAFLAMTLLLARSFGELESVRRPVIAAALLTLGFSLLLEVLQSLVPWRSFEVLDLVADTVGVLLALLPAKWVISRNSARRSPD